MHPAAAQVVDGAAISSVLVYGSLPPAGRDLDVLLRTADRAPVVAALEASGFERFGRTWVRRGGDAVEAVDLRVPSDWGLPAAEVDDLLAAALPVPGYQRLVRPGPAHVLLLLARRVAGGDGGLDGPRRDRLEAALREDPDAWSAAAAHAPAWGASRALEVLRAARAGTPAARRARAAARAERLQAEGQPRPLAAARAWRSVVRGGRPRAGVVAICGLDGAGKSSQSAALAAALEQLGRPAVTQWTRLSYDPALDALARPVKKAVRALRRRPAPVPADVDASRVATPEQRIRQSSPAMTAVWAAVVAVSNGLAQRRSTRPHLAAGRIVVCDRWTLDSGVHLRYRYGETRRFRLQVAIIRVLSPAPLVTCFLDIPAETAYARKDDHYDVGQLARQERLYQQEHPRHGAVRLDGTRPPDELSAEILRVVLAELERRRW